MLTHAFFLFNRRKSQYFSSFGGVWPFSQHKSINRLDQEIHPSRPISIESAKNQPFPTNDERMRNYASSNSNHVWLKPLPAAKTVIDKSFGRIRQFKFKFSWFLLILISYWNHSKWQCHSLAVNCVSYLKLVQILHSNIICQQNANYSTVINPVGSKSIYPIHHLRQELFATQQIQHTTGFYTTRFDGTGFPLC